MNYTFKNIKSYSPEPKNGYTECFVSRSSCAGSIEKIFIDITQKDIVSARILDFPYYLDKNDNTHKELTTESGCQPIAFNRQVLRVFTAEAAYDDIEAMDVKTP